jgi:Leucine-rich repeat (LRR) protein
MQHSLLHIQSADATACVCLYLQATTLKELDLSGNLLVELPHSLATLPKLEVH